MGGRGAMIGKGFVTQEFKSVGTIAGVKILEYVDPGNKRPKLPTASNTPGTSYLMKDTDGNLERLKIYGDDRIQTKDIDYHKHKGVLSLHAHDYKDGVKIPTHRDLTSAEMKEHDKIIRAMKRRKE